MLSPSGEQFEIAFGQQRVVAVEVGAGLRTICRRRRGRPRRLRPRRDGVGGSRPGAHPVAEPSPGRQLRVRRTSASASTDGDGTLERIHGLVRWVAWRAREHEPHRVVLGHVLHAQPGYPFTLELADRVRADRERSHRTDDCDEHREGAVSVRKRRAPVPHAGGGDDRRRAAPRAARTALSSDDRGIPVGSVAVDGTELDFRSARRVGRGEARQRLHRPRARRRTASLGFPSRREGRGRTLWVDEGYPYVMVFTGDIPSVQRRGLAVEPMTCPPNAFRSGEALVTLEPGESHTASWGLSPTVEVRE